MVPYAPEFKGNNPEAPEGVLVIDAGFSFTHVVPLVRGSIASQGVRRCVGHGCAMERDGSILTAVLRPPESTSAASS